MVTGGSRPPAELGSLPKSGTGAGAVALASSSTMMNPMSASGGGGTARDSTKSGVTGGGGAVPNGATIVQLRNKKKAALESIAKECNLKPESIKKAYKKFQVINKDKSGLVDYTEFCEILEVDSGPAVEAAFQVYDHDKITQIDMKEVGR